MTNTAERVETPKGFGLVTGRSSDGTTVVTLDNGRILAFPNDQVEPLVCADVQVGDTFRNVDGERVEVVETADRVLYFRDELAFRYPVQRKLLAALLADGVWSPWNAPVQPVVPAPRKAMPSHVAKGRIPAVSPAGGCFLLEVYSNECQGRGPKAAFHSYAAAARALVRSGHLVARGGGYFELSATGRVWAEGYQIAAAIAGEYVTALNAEYTEETRRAHLGNVDQKRAWLVQAIRMLFKVTVKQADRAILTIVHQGLSVAVAVRECRAAH
jgi:hypothetical protein